MQNSTVTNANFRRRLCDEILRCPSGTGRKICKSVQPGRATRTACHPAGEGVNRHVSIGLLPVYSIDPSQHNDTSVRSSVRTTEGLESHGSGSSQTPECIPGRLERLPVPRGVEDKCGDISNVNTEI